MLFDVEKKFGRAKFGLMANESWQQDPKRTLFTLSRYKFVSKMLINKNNVLEIGCADAFGTRLVQQSVANVTAIDFDPVFIEDVQERSIEQWPLNCFVHDILKSPPPTDKLFDAIYSLDVLEHIHPSQEHIFMDHSLSVLSDDGVMIIGMPSLESQQYASPQSKEGHVNCKSGSVFQDFLRNYFRNVFLFSMNDEVVHTGYSPMAHYLLALCVGKTPSQV